MATLIVFLDLPVPWSLVAKIMKQVEAVVGPVQIWKSEMDTLVGDIESHKEHGDEKPHGCTIVDHIHPPLPMIKGEYGNYNVYCNYVIIL